MLVPGLAADFSGYADDIFPPAPALSRWLGRSKPVALSGADADSAACALFGLDGRQPPAAALAYLADFSEAPDGLCFRLDPVHLRADTRGLVLFDAPSAGLNDEEGRALFELVRPWLEEDGWTARYAAADRWYVSHSAPSPVPLTRPLAQVTGQPVSACLPAGEGAGDWLRRINELQMLFNSHAVNRQRARHGHPLINGLWLWGGGALPSPGQVMYTQLQTRRSVLSGLASLHGIAQVHGIPHAGSLPAGSDALLVDLDACESAAATGDVQRWCEALEHLEHDWFAPLLSALMRGAIQQLDLVPLNGFRYPLRRADLLAFWRRSVYYRNLCRGRRR